MVHYTQHHQIAIFKIMAESYIVTAQIAYLKQVERVEGFITSTCCNIFIWRYSDNGILHFFLIFFNT
jgi:hypothetical protein